jgi:exodeoxyribonuclease VIII
MTIEEDVLKWWAKQSPEAIEAAFSESNRIMIEDVLKELFKFSKHCERFWAKSPEFDLSILQFAAKKANLGVPWSYYQERDIRTLEELTGFDTKDLNGHDALSDAYNEAMIVQKGYKKLGMIRPKWPE